MRRREVILLVGGAAAWPIAVRAQAARSTGLAIWERAPAIPASSSDALPRLANELIGRQVSVIANARVAGCQECHAENSLTSTTPSSMGRSPGASARHRGGRCDLCDVSSARRGDNARSAIQFPPGAHRPWAWASIAWPIAFANASSHEPEPLALVQPATAPATAPVTAPLTAFPPVTGSCFSVFPAYKKGAHKARSACRPSSIPPVNAAAHDSSSRQGRSRRLEFGLLGLYVADLLEGNHSALRNEHHDGRNVEECCKSLGSD